MANQQQIDKSSEQIVTLVDKARSEIITDLYNIRRAYTVGAFADILLTIDIEGTLKKKLQKATNTFVIAHRQVLESTVAFAPANKKVLSGLIALNEQLFDNSVIRTISGHIRTELIKGIQAGLSASQIVEGVINSSISKGQMQTLINTALNTYSRQVTLEMMNEAPSNTKYQYIGPIDGKTRDLCLRMGSAGELTQNQIIRNFGADVLVDGGGFNCRHKWQSVSDVGVSKNVYNPKKAEGLIASGN